MVAVEIAALFGALAVIVLKRQTADWDLTLLAVLLAFSIVSDVAAVDTPGSVKISGSSSPSWSRWSFSAVLPLR